jgi:hypothetical protein
MDQAQVALKLFLDDLGLPPTIRRVSDRKAVQKAVYLGQAAGVDLGYRYNWYRMGPYSPGLTRDYFALADEINDTDSNTVGDFELRDSVRRRLQRIRPLLDVPGGVALAQPDWLELVASVHFLLKRRCLSVEEARKVLQEEKRHVAQFMDAAVTSLEDGGLLAA